MLGTPDVGWSEFSICNEHTYGLSYLTDVVVEWLDQAIHGLTTMQPFTVHGFCEPGRMLCTVSYWNCYIVFESDESDSSNPYHDMYGVDLSMIKFCKLLYADVSRDIEAWVHWDDTSLIECDENDYYAACLEGDNLSDDNQCDYDSSVETVLDMRRKLILDKLGELKNLIDLNEEHFGLNRCFF